MPEIDRRTFIGAGIAAAAAGLAAPRAWGQGATQTPVKIGVLGDFSASYANISGKPMVEAVKMAVEDFGGRLLGKPIEIVSANSELKPDIASGIARNWWDNDNVDVITDLPGSAMALAVIGLAAPRKKIVFATSAVSSEISGKSCTPYTVQWNYDTYSVAHSIGPGNYRQGRTRLVLHFVGYDHRRFRAEGDFRRRRRQGRKGAGRGARAHGHDGFLVLFSLQAQASNTQVICFSVAGHDGITLTKQAAEYGLIGASADPEKKIMITGCFTQPDDLRSVGLQTAQGLLYASAFDWNIDDETRAFSKRFFARADVMPNQNMAATYSSMLHYFNAVKAVGSKDADAVMAQMRATKVNDVFAKNGELRIDGRMAHGGYVMQAKGPKDSTGPWDIATALAYVPADVAVRPARRRWLSAGKIADEHERNDAAVGGDKGARSLARAGGALRDHVARRPRRRRRQGRVAARGRPNAQVGHRASRRRNHLLSSGQSFEAIDRDRLLAPGRGGVGARPCAAERRADRELYARRSGAIRPRTRGAAETKSAIDLLLPFGLWPHRSLRASAGL